MVLKTFVCNVSLFESEFCELCIRASMDIEGVICVCGVGWGGKCVCASPACKLVCLVIMLMRAAPSLPHALSDSFLTMTVVLRTCTVCSP